MSVEEKSPAERADELRRSFEKALDAMAADGEPLNIVLSKDVRESLRQHLRRSAEVIVASEQGPLLTDLTVSTTAEALPHATKGQIGEALSEFIKEATEEAESDGGS